MRILSIAGIIPNKIPIANVNRNTKLLVKGSFGTRSSHTLTIPVKKIPKNMRRDRTRGTIPRYKTLSKPQDPIRFVNSRELTADRTDTLFMIHSLEMYIAQERKTDSNPDI